MVLLQGTLAAHGFLPPFMTFLYDEPLNRSLVPCYARPCHAFDNRHPLLNLKWFGKDRVPPVGVFEEMRGRRGTHELRADFRPEMIREGDAASLAERRGPHPSGHAANLHHIRHHVV